MRNGLFLTRIHGLTPYFDGESGGSGGSSGGNAHSGGEQEGQKRDAGTGGGSDGTGKGQESPPTFTQADMDRVVEKRLKEEGERIARQVREDIEREATEAEAKKQGDFKKLYEALETKYQTLEADLKRRDREDLLRKVAREVGLPETATVRLIGETEEELTKDAKELKKQLAASTKVVDTRPGNSGSPKNGVDDGKNEWADPNIWQLPT